MHCEENGWDQSPEVGFGDGSGIEGVWFEEREEVSRDKKVEEEKTVRIHILYTSTKEHLANRKESSKVNIYVSLPPLHPRRSLQSHLQAHSHPARYSNFDPLYRCVFVFSSSISSTPPRLSRISP